MPRTLTLTTLSIAAIPSSAFASGVDAIVVIPLYVVLFILTVISFGNIERGDGATALAMICGAVLFLNWIFSLGIYLKWLANAVNNLGIALLLAAISPFLIVHLTNKLIRTVK